MDSLKKCKNSFLSGFDSILGRIDFFVKPLFYVYSRVLDSYQLTAMWIS